MQRYSISLDDDLAVWVESQADTRGVSRAKIIRDAVALARESDVEMVQSSDVIDRLDALEQRVAELEARERAATGDELADALAEERGRDPAELEETESSSGAGTSEAIDADDLRAAVEEDLTGRPPQSDAAQAAVLTVWERLREVETEDTADLREYAFERHGESYDSAKSLWQSIQRHLETVPGIEKGGYGTWEYAGDDVVREEAE